MANVLKSGYKLFLSLEKIIPTPVAAMFIAGLVVKGGKRLSIRHGIKTEGKTYSIQTDSDIMPAYIEEITPDTDYRDKHYPEYRTKIKERFNEQEANRRKEFKEYFKGGKKK